MARKFMEIVLTDSVKNAQEKFYGRHQSAATGSPVDALTKNEQSFIQERDSFYMATVNEDGWPYIQHRGGPKGFLKVITPSRLAFADYKGNRQLISSGNLSQQNRVALFLMDYPSRTRLKLLGNVTLFPNSEIPQDTAEQIGADELRKAERLFVIDIVSFDWNCPQYITPRYSHEEISPLIEGLKKRIQELENAAKK